MRLFKPKPFLTKPFFEILVEKKQEQVNKSLNRKKQTWWKWTKSLVLWRKMTDGTDLKIHELNMYKNA